MEQLSVDYTGLVASLGHPLNAASLGTALFRAVARRYESRQQACSLYEFEQTGAHYLFDLASPLGLPQEDRTVAAWALTPSGVTRRDTTYQRGFPMVAITGGALVDRGHVIPHLSGGEFGPNIFVQDRALNRGWSPQGKRYRALEREAARKPGTFYFAHLLYRDDTAYPAAIEIGLLRGTAFHVEQFDNRPDER